jgi:hypothetical protein
LKHPHLIVAAFADDEMIGIARATFDGLSAHITEFSVDLRYQGGSPKYTNGSLIEADSKGVGGQLGKRLLSELMAMGATFITCYIVANCEQAFYHLCLNALERARDHAQFFTPSRNHRCHEELVSLIDPFDALEPNALTPMLRLHHGCA